MIHWTLALITFLATTLFVVLFVQWRFVGSVRLVGVLIGAAWVVQQAFFWVAGDELPVGLFIVCDALICGYLWRSRFHWTDTAILVIYPVMWVAYFTLEPTPLWWFLYWLTITQMALAMPWPSLVGLRDKEFSYGGQ